MTTVNHWGIWVDSEVPTTGVLFINSIDWEWFDYSDEICLDCEQAYEEVEQEIQEIELASHKGNPIHCAKCGGECQYDIDGEYLGELPSTEFIECDSSHTKLIGDWIKGDDGKYEPDKMGEYAAIENESTVQVVWSKYTAKGALCSPCYPGQVDLDSKGEFLGYTLPPELLHKEN